MESNEKTKSRQGVELRCHGPIWEGENVMNAIMLEEESDTAVTIPKHSEVEALKDVDTMEKANADEKQNRNMDDGQPSDADFVTSRLCDCVT